MRSPLSRLNGCFRVHAATQASRCIARPPCVVAAITSINWLRSSRARFIASPLSVPEHADGDHLVKGAVELVAAAHVADQHEVGTDYAGQLEARVHLSDHAQAAQSIMPPAAVTAWAASFGARP